MPVSWSILIPLRAELTTLADIVERFQLALMLCVIALRNMIEMAGSDLAFLPKSFIRGRSLVDSIFSVSIMYHCIADDVALGLRDPF